MYNTSWLNSQKYYESPYRRLCRLSSIQDSGCILYTGNKDQYGYGRFKVGGKNLGAHKISYLLHVGDYDQENLELSHTCDNPACINPTHLVPASHEQNIQDSLNKGRHSSQQQWFKPYGFKRGGPILDTPVVETAAEADETAEE